MKTSDIIAALARRDLPTTRPHAPWPAQTYRADWTNGAVDQCATCQQPVQYREGSGWLHVSRMRHGIPDSPTQTGRGHPAPEAPMVPGGADPVELCTSPTDGRICLQVVADRRMTPVCDGCAEDLSTYLASRGVES